MHILVKIKEISFSSWIIRDERILGDFLVNFKWMQ